MYQRFFRRNVYLWIWVLISSTSFAYCTDLPIPERGVLRIILPPTWTESNRATPAGLPPTLTMKRSGVPRSNLQVTVLWSPKSDPSFAQEKNVRVITLAGQEAILSSAVEKELPLQPIHGAQGSGFYYSATDKNYKPVRGVPDPNDFPIVTHGELSAGSVVLSFTILGDAKDDSGVREALLAIRSAVVNPIQTADNGISKQLHDLLNRTGLMNYPVTTNIGTLHAEVLYQLDVNVFKAGGGRTRTSLNIQGNSTTLYLYDFQSKDNADHAAAFAAGSLWGGSKPTREHKDELLQNGTLLLVISGDNPDTTARQFEKFSFKRHREKE